MTAHLRALAADPDLRAALTRSGLARIAQRHTCAHRAEELLAVYARLTTSPASLRPDLETAS
jgi:spore maturation protein CgeB